MRDISKYAWVGVILAASSAAMLAQQKATEANLLVLHEFTGEPDGAYPGGSNAAVPGATLVSDASGALYGTTYSGGAADVGAVFQLMPPPVTGGSWTESVLYSFTGGADGEEPYGGLVLDAKGNLYGTTYYGGTYKPGCIYGCGVIFQLIRPAAPDGTWTESVLYRFTGGSDGANPGSALVFDEKGALYGAGFSGGAAAAVCPGGLGQTPGCGVIFRLAPPPVAGGPWTYRVLYRFIGGADGAIPFAGVTFHGAALYGITALGGTANFGTIFQLAPRAAAGEWTETVLHTFTGGSDGAFPVSGVVFDRNGVLYGAAAYGGSSSPQCSGFYSGCGTVFQLMPSAVAGSWTFGVTFTFAEPVRGGEYPCCLVFSESGELYGATEYGGDLGGYGVVFRLKPPASQGGVWTQIVLQAFTSGHAIPDGLLFGQNHALYGTTSGGFATGQGTLGDGSVFQLTP